MAAMLAKTIAIGAILDSVAHQRHQMRANEFTPGNRDLIIFDIDDTLLHTTAKIKVVQNGQVVRTLTNQEFNNYNLAPGEEFDFGEFRNAEKFRQESKPIAPMIRKLKTILSHAGNAKVIMLTARADFDDKETFLQTFQDLGIDMSRVHVHRAGNLPGNEAPAYKKAVWVRKYLNTRQYGHVRLYDDSMSNLKVFKDLKKEYPQVDFRALYVGPTGSTQVIENQEDYEIHNYEKLDNILEKLCGMIDKGLADKSKKPRMVAACVLDINNNAVARLSSFTDSGWRHAERNAIDNYNKKYGEIPKGSIIVTTLSPCNEHNDETANERFGLSCTDLINQSNIKKVYCGLIDPSQENEQRSFTQLETADKSIRQRCKEFAATFLDELHENFENEPTDNVEFHINSSDNFNTAFEVNLRQGNKDVGFFAYKFFPRTNNVENDVFVHNSLRGKGYGKLLLLKAIEVAQKNDLPFKPDRNGITDEQRNVYQSLISSGQIRVKPDKTIILTRPVSENFADGRNPQDKGDSKRHGVPTKASVSTLRKVAKQGGRKGQLAHWMANMKAGRAKKK